MDERVEAVKERARQFTFTDRSMTADELYHLFDEMRAVCPVAKSDAIESGSYLVAGYENINRCLRDAATFTTTGPAPLDMLPLHSAPPEHTLYRKDLNPPFALAKVQEMEAELGVRVREYVRPIVERGHGELVAELTVPFPCVSFMMLLGAPLSDLDALIVWKDVIFEAFEGEPEAREKLEKVALPEMTAYFNRLLDERAAAEDPPDDLMTAVARAQFGERPYRRDEMISFCIFLMIAGLDTVTGMWSRMLWYLAEHPEQRAILVKDPTSIPGAIEEMMRYLTTISPHRHTTTEVELGGFSLKAGDRVELLMPSAGRDEEAYEDPMTVDFGREHVRHLAFGGGVHRCLGSHLARTELKVGLEAVMELMPDFHLDPRHEPKLRIGINLNVDELYIIVGQP